MENQAESAAVNQSSNAKILSACFSIGTFFIYYFSNPRPQNHFDYTFRVAENFLRGAIGFTERPPSWLNEFVPFETFYYSVFPLGSVLTMIPFAFFKFFGIIEEMPAAFIAALTASAIGWFLLLIAGRYELSRGKRLLLAAAILFGTWMWTNLMMTGAWQLALGFAMLGELGAIYYTVYNRRPLLAGFFFALAFGNRTEIILTAPIFMLLFLRSNFRREKPQTLDENSEEPNREKQFSETEFRIASRQSAIGALAAFCVVPFVLGVSTLVYNYVRFHSFTDFGYARIPGVLDEPWYQYGIFSVSYIPLNAREMLYTPWRWLADFPYLVPTGFGGSILWSSPFVFLIARFGARDRVLKYTAWAAIVVQTFLLWIHGNPGGWQFSYRYAMVLLPWMFIILLESSPKKITVLEWLTIVFSIVVNALATYLFFWTDYVKP